MVGTEKLSSVLWCKCLDIWFLVQLTINIFIYDFDGLQAKLHFLQKRQDNAVTWCILVLSLCYIISHAWYDELSLSESIQMSR